MIPAIFEATALIDLSSVDFSGLTATITSVVPIALPIVVTLLGIRKGISFLIGMVKRG